MAKTKTHKITHFLVGGRHFGSIDLPLGDNLRRLPAFDFSLRSLTHLLVLPHGVGGVALQKDQGVVCKKRRSRVKFGANACHRRKSDQGVVWFA